MQYIQVKSILSKLKQADTWFGITYNMNLYRGCQHSCIYCDTRSECYQVGDISQISVKQNALDLLKKELHSKRNNKAVIGTGSMNDPYMPIERDIQLTRNALKIIAENNFPIHVITKSDLIVRDIDILEKIKLEYAAISFTITTANNELANKIEPNAPTPSKRFEAMAKLAKESIYTGITMMPILPFINDTVENIKTILNKAKDSGAAYVLPMFGVTLRKGSREYFYTSLEQNFPQLKEKYIKTYRNQYECWSPNYQKLNECFYEEIEKLKLDSKIKFYVQSHKSSQLELF